MREYQFEIPCIVTVDANSDKEARAKLRNNAVKIDEDVTYGEVRVYLPRSYCDTAKLIEDEED